MNVVDIAVLSVIAVSVVSTVVVLVRHRIKRKGGQSCGDVCDGCPGCGDKRLKCLVNNESEWVSYTI